MDMKKIGPTALLGFGALAAGVIAVLLGRKPRQGDTATSASGTAGSTGNFTRGPDRFASADTRTGQMADGPTGKAEQEKGFQERSGTPANEHVPTDLLSDAPVTTATRAPEAFRPDPTAVPTAEEREALRPATGPAPTLAADRGSMNA